MVILELDSEAIVEIVAALCLTGMIISLVGYFIWADRNECDR